MMQITWMLGLLPDWFWSTLLIAGSLAILASFVLGSVPFIKNYKLPVQISGILAVVLSVWCLGAASNEEKWQVKIRELEAQVKAAEQKSQETNTVIESKVVEKTKIIKGKTEYITQYLDREVVKKEEIIKYIEQCPVPKEIIDLHNQATELNKAAEGKK